MKRRILSLALLAMIVVATLAPAASAEPFTMYVYTESGSGVYVRAEARTDAEKIGLLSYGQDVLVTQYMPSIGWAEIMYGSLGEGYVPIRYLQNYTPDPKPSKSSSKATPAPTADNSAQIAAQIAAINLANETASMRPLAEAMTIIVRTARASGWVNFRVGPGSAAAIITTYPDGKQLRALSETNGWYQAQDMETGKVGFINKNYVTVMPAQPVAAAAEKSEIGKLSVNGEFTLQGILPEGYTMQVVNMMGSKIVASINPTNGMEPIMYLSIAYNDEYADIERMNDMSEEELAILEKTFTDMNAVDISYGETAYGTKLLIARENGDDSDFVDIMTVYKGYSIEFVMSPNPTAANQSLSNEQVQMCIDFLSNLDFVETK